MSSFSGQKVWVEFPRIEAVASSSSKPLIVTIPSISGGYVIYSDAYLRDSVVRWCRMGRL